MKAIMISINPKWGKKIARGEKTEEVRKTAPKEVPFKAYMYMTKDCKKHYYIDEYGDRQVELIPQKVVGEFVCDRVDRIPLIYSDIWEDNILQGYSPIAGCTERRLQSLIEQSCLTHDEIVDYLLSNDELFEKPHEACFEHITELKIYDEPKEVSEFKYRCPNKKRCSECKYYVPMDDCARSLTCPPQSWGYVEALK